jgi:hypothetical protein
MWPVVKGGYEIKTIPAQDGTTLTKNPEHEIVIAKERGEIEMRDYMGPSLRSEPILNGEPMLFRTFGELNQSYSSVLTFANRFGLLTRSVTGRYEAEPLDLWYSEIEHMRDQIEMVEKGVYRSGDWPSAVVGFAEESSTSLGIGLSPIGPNNSMKLKINIPTLRQALWVQLGLWISRPRMNLRKCPYCGHWFTYGGPDGFRKSRKFCRRKCANDASQLYDKE